MTSIGRGGHEKCGKALVRSGEARAFPAFLKAAATFADTSIKVANGTALLGGVPDYIFASVAILAALLDLSVILRRGLRRKAAHRAPSLTHAAPARRPETAPL